MRGCEVGIGFMISTFLQSALVIGWFFFVLLGFFVGVVLVLVTILTGLR